MEQKHPKGKPVATEREARLKAALKANLQRRKAQAKARLRADGANEADEQEG